MMVYSVHFEDPNGDQVNFTFAYDPKTDDYLTYMYRLQSALGELCKHQRKRYINTDPAEGRYALQVIPEKGTMAKGDSEHLYATGVSGIAFNLSEERLLPPTAWDTPERPVATLSSTHEENLRQCVDAIMHHVLNKAFAWINYKKENT